MKKLNNRNEKLQIEKLKIENSKNSNRKIAKSKTREMEKLYRCSKNDGLTQ